MILRPKFPDRRTPEQKRHKMWRDFAEQFKDGGIVIRAGTKALIDEMESYKYPKRKPCPPPSF